MICGNISGVILAGGSNNRFGGTLKAKILIDGQRIIDRALETLREIFDEIIIITNTPSEFNDINDCKIAEDYIKNKGPLGGIHAAMKKSSKEAIFVFAGDMPFLSGKLIIKQAGSYYHTLPEAFVPEHDNNIEPLHGIYSCRMMTKLEEHLNNTDDLNIRRFLEKINVVYYKPGNRRLYLKAFTNINTPSEATIAGKK
jgi:molybdopterin-guanine dinucleotide biosynthesis protein A